MATVQGMTLDRLLALEADTVIGGHIDGAGDLILEQHDGSTINAGSAIPAVPDATETVKGKVELATTAEATAGTDTVRAVTPAGLAAAVPTASTTAQGKVELATDSEATTGTDTSRAITPANLRAVLSAMFPVGYIYISASNTSPATLFGFGTWTAIQGRFLIAENGTRPAGTTGGAASVTLTEANLPSHTHSFSATSGSGGAHQHAIGVDSIASTGSGKFAINSPGNADGDAGSLSTGTYDSSTHTHSVSGTTGGGAGTATSFGILPLWLSVYMWQRTA